MRSAAKYAACVLPFLLTGCFHLPFHKRRPQPQMLAPSILPYQTIELASIVLPPSAMIIPTKPLANLEGLAQPMTPPGIHKRAASRTAEEGGNSQEETGKLSPAVSVIGVLSSGDPASVGRQTADSIAEIERGLNAITRPLSEPEQKTAQHIQQFLKQAKAALASGDVDGARTLAAKARVLLAGLTQ